MGHEFNVDMNEYLPLRDVVFNTLRQAILKGELKPGERLMEIQLANRLGVSRTPVREAIRKLELEGLVLMIPRKGAIVAEITIKDLEDVLEVRGVLEILAVQNACQNITETQLQELKNAATNNRRLLQLLNNLREQMYRYRMEYLKDKRMHKTLVDEHEAIRKALKKHDPVKAGNAVKVHIENQRKCIIDSLTSEKSRMNETV